MTNFQIARLHGSRLKSLIRWGEVRIWREVTCCYYLVLTLTTLYEVTREVNRRNNPWMNKNSISQGPENSTFPWICRRNFPSINRWKIDGKKKFHFANTLIKRALPVFFPQKFLTSIYRSLIPRSKSLNFLVLHMSEKLCSKVENRVKDQEFELCTTVAVY